MTSLHDRTARLREAVVPGWLAEVMPGWLTQAVRPKTAPVPWGAMVRAALAICVPLSVGILVGRRDTGLVLAIGGLTGTVIDTGGPYVVRVKRAVIAGVFGGAAGLVIGMLIHHRGWVAVASLVIIAGVSALISRLGSTASVTGLQLLVFAALGLGPLGALRPWWHIVLGYAAGVAWALLLLVPGWLRSPRSAEQSAVADAYHALAGDLCAIGTDRTAETRHAVTTALNTAYDTLLDQLRGGRLAWTFTIRLMVCVGVAAVASEVLPLQRSYWVVLTVAIVVTPDNGSVFARAVQRGIGTIVGAVLGAVILVAVPYGPWLLFPMAVLAAPRRTAGRHAARLRDRAARRVRAVAEQLALKPATAVRRCAA